MPERRIASLVPSATELLYALGFGPWLVARTGFCIHPAAALHDIPKVGGTKDVNLQRLRTLAPSHVLLNVDENRRETWEAIRDWPGVECLITHPQGPRDVPALVAQLLAAFGPSAAAEPLLQELAQALDLPRPTERSVLYLIWRDPWMTVARDTYISRLLAEAGWATQPAQHGGPEGAARYPALPAQDPLWHTVDEIWLSSEPYRFGPQHLAEVQALAPQARVRLVDGELCSWWGARTAQGLAYLRALHAR